MLMLLSLKSLIETDSNIFKIRQFHDNQKRRNNRLHKTCRELYAQIIERAKGYARRAYAFGEIGEVTYVMYKAAMKIKFKEWNPTEEITETFEFIKEFAEDDSEPVVLKLENLDPLYFEMDNGGLVCQNRLEF